MIGALYRSKKYDAKVGGANYLSDLTAQQTSMQANFAERTISMSAADASVKQTCDASGVDTIQYPFYLAFGREMWSAVTVRMFSGESMAKLAAVYVAKWTARGLTAPVLQAIRNEVFNVGAPIVP